MKPRDQATGRSGRKAGARARAASAAAPKRIAADKRSGPSRKASPPKKAAAKKAAPVKKPAPPKKPAMAPKPAPAMAKPAPGAPAAGPATPKAPGSATGPSAEERRRAATRKLFARIRSLEAIVGADLRKRGSVVLMQAVDQWYSETIGANATEITITNAAKAVIAQL